MIEKLKSATEYFYKFRLQVNKDLWSEIDEYARRTQSTGAKYATLFHLYVWVMKLKPQTIVECGTGLSTIVICKAVEHLKQRDASYSPSFVSLESEEFYRNHACALLPEKYKGTVDIRLCSLAEDSYSMFRGVRYDFSPDAACDFAFIDGPSYKTDKGGGSFCFDLLNYIGASEKPVYAIIDTRVSTVYVLQKILGKALVRYNGLQRVGFVYGACRRDMAVLTEPPSSHFSKSFWSGALRLRLKK